MTIDDLTKEQLQQLKVKYLDELLYEKEKRSISYGEIITIDEIITDEEIKKAYDFYTFTTEDFF